jgi:hypothetical protein
MFKFLIKPFLSFILLSCLYSFVISDNDSLLWSKNVKLNWSDFKGTVPANSNGTVANTNYSVNYHPSISNDTLFVQVVSLFNYDRSWVIEFRETDILLEHEQRHFDLAEIQARKLRQYIFGWDKKIEISTYLSNGNDSINKACDKLQDLYDLETEHSKDIEQQNKWSKKIDSLLNAYRLYENPIVKIPFKKR